MNSCPQDQQWLEFLDQEITDDRDAAFQSHVESCQTCQARLHEIAVLSAGTAEAFSVPEEGKTRRLFGRHTKLTQTSLVASLGALVFGTSLISPGGRHALASVWHTLSFGQVNAVQISPQQLQTIASRLTQGGRVNIRHYGSVNMTQLNHPPASVGWATARRTNNELNVWPKSWPVPQVSVNPAARLTLTLKVQAINQLLKAEGDKILFPQALNRVPISVQIPQVFTLSTPPAPNPHSAYVSLMVSSVPKLRIPQGLNMTQVSQAIQALPFLPQRVSQQLAAMGRHFHSMLLIPSPGPVTHVRIQGDPGVITNAGGGDYQVTWIHHQTLYSLNYQGSPHLGLKAFERQVSRWFPMP